MKSVKILALAASVLGLASALEVTPRVDETPEHAKIFDRAEIVTVDEKRGAKYAHMAQDLEVKNVHGETVVFIGSGHDGRIGMKIPHGETLATTKEVEEGITMAKQNEISKIAWVTAPDEQVAVQISKMIRDQKQWQPLTVHAFTYPPESGPITFMFKCPDTYPHSDPYVMTQPVKIEGDESDKDSDHGGHGDSGRSGGGEDGYDNRRHGGAPLRTRAIRSKRTWRSGGQHTDGGGPDGGDPDRQSPGGRSPHGRSPGRQFSGTPEGDEDDGTSSEAPPRRTGRTSDGQSQGGQEGVEDDGTASEAPPRRTGRNRWQPWKTRGRTSDGQSQGGQEGVKDDGTSPPRRIWRNPWRASRGRHARKEYLYGGGPDEDWGDNITVSSIFGRPTYANENEGLTVKKIRGQVVVFFTGPGGHVGLKMQKHLSSRSKTKMVIKGIALAQKKVALKRAYVLAADLYVVNQMAKMISDHRPPEYLAVHRILYPHRTAPITIRMRSDSAVHTIPAEPLDILKGHTSQEGRKTTEPWGAMRNGVTHDRPDGGPWMDIEEDIVPDRPGFRGDHGGDDNDDDIRHDRSGHDDDDDAVYDVHNGQLYRSGSSRSGSHGSRTGSNRGGAYDAGGDDYYDDKGPRFDIYDDEEGRHSRGLKRHHGHNEDHSGRRHGRTRHKDGDDEYDEYQDASADDVEPEPDE